MALDQYALKARYGPALITIVLPIAIFNHYFTSPEFAKLVGYVSGSVLVSNLTISAVCLYFFAEFGRVLGKNLFERWYFRDEARMPTTDFLMHCNRQYSEEYKQRFDDQVKKQFGLSLPTHDEEIADEKTARVRIVEIMALVRKKLKANRFLLQHNIEYGAMRNAIGGAVIGIAICVWNIVFFYVIFPSRFAVFISSALLVPYTLLVLLSKWLIDFYGRNYAKILFREFMGS